MDYSPPGSSVHGIILTRLVVWVAISSSRGIFLTQGLNLCLLQLLPWQADTLPLAPPGKPQENTRRVEMDLSSKCTADASFLFFFFLSHVLWATQWTAWLEDQRRYWNPTSNCNFEWDHGTRHRVFRCWKNTLCWINTDLRRELKWTVTAL